MADNQTDAPSYAHLEYDPAPNLNPDEDDYIFGSIRYTYMHGPKSTAPTSTYIFLDDPIIKAPGAKLAQRAERTLHGVNIRLDRLDRELAAFVTAADNAAFCARFGLGYGDMLFAYPDPTGLSYRPRYPPEPVSFHRHVRWMDFRHNIQPIRRQIREIQNRAATYRNLATWLHAAKTIMRKDWKDSRNRATAGFIDSLGATQDDIQDDTQDDASRNTTADPSTLSKIAIDANDIATTNTQEITLSASNDTAVVTSSPPEEAKHLHIHGCWRIH